MRTTKAFTVIELLVTFGIIAVLATVAAPTYSKYRIRAKVSSMFTAASAAEFAVQNDYFNQNNSFAGITYSAGSQPFLIPQTSTISSMAISAGVITITGNSADLGGRSLNLVFTPIISNGEINWSCAITAAYVTYAPPQCQNTI